jgi:hypothetical protein
MCHPINIHLYFRVNVTQIVLVQAYFSLIWTPCAVDEVLFWSGSGRHECE